jgi:Family of unknown function (DUF6152)
MRKLVAITMGAMVLGSVAAPAHHSGAMFDREKIVTFTGVVKEFDYANPHTWLYVTVTEDNGAETVWAVETEGPSALMRAGIRKSSLMPGDKVTVQTNPLRDGRPAGAWLAVTKADGTRLMPRPNAAPPVAAPAN